MPKKQKHPVRGEKMKRLPRWKEGGSCASSFCTLSLAASTESLREQPSAEQADARSLDGTALGNAGIATRGDHLNIIFNIITAEKIVNKKPRERGCIKRGSAMRCDAAHGGLCPQYS